MEEAVSSSHLYAQLIDSVERLIGECRSSHINKTSSPASSETLPSSPRSPATQIRKAKPEKEARHESRPKQSCARGKRSRPGTGPGCGKLGWVPGMAAARF